MKATALKNSTWLLAAVFASLVWLGTPQKSFAADTQVSCTAPVVVLWEKGGGPTPSAQITIDCTGGSSAGYQYYAFRVKDNPTLASLIPTVVGQFLLWNGPGATITLSSDLSDLSGWTWGCGNANCRIIDQLYGY